MLSILTTNIVFNDVEYFSYINIWIVCLLFYIISLFIIISSSLLFLSSVYFIDYWVELILTIISLIILSVIIAPSLVILLDSDSNILASFIVETIGYQWAWNFNITLLSPTSTFNTYCDHYIISSLHCSNWSYLFDVNYLIIFPSSISARLYLVSFDVIHSFGLLGLKVDTIPGKINIASTIRSMFKGMNKGSCYELCGELHSTMLILALII